MRQLIAKLADWVRAVKMGVRVQVADGVDGGDGAVEVHRLKRLELQHGVQRNVEGALWTDREVIESSCEGGLEWASADGHAFLQVPPAVAHASGASSRVVVGCFGQTHVPSEHRLEGADATLGETGDVVFRSSLVAGASCVYCLRPNPRVVLLAVHFGAAVGSADGVHSETDVAIVVGDD
jgi:hypothetical protein